MRSPQPQRVTVDGEDGTLTAVRDDHILVRFDDREQFGTKPLKCHPAWRVYYHQEAAAS